MALKDGRSQNDNLAGFRRSIENEHRLKIKQACESLLEDHTLITYEAVHLKMLEISRLLGTDYPVLQTDTLRAKKLKWRTLIERYMLQQQNDPVIQKQQFSNSLDPNQLEHRNYVLEEELLVMQEKVKIFEDKVQKLNEYIHKLQNHYDAATSGKPILMTDQSENWNDILSHVINTILEKGTDLHIDESNNLVLMGIDQYITLMSAKLLKKTTIRGSDRNVHKI